MIKRILCVANGYPAESGAVTLALDLAARYRARLTALYVVAADWTDILGDEWISTATARRHFYRYLGRELKKQVQVALESIGVAGNQLGLEVVTLVKTGVPEKVIVTVCTGPDKPDLLILPYPPEKNVLNTLRLHPGKILGRVPCPVLMASSKTAPARK